MKKMFKILSITILLFSCSNDDDTTEIIDDGFLRPELTKSFLLGEKWYLYEATSEQTGEDLLTDVLTCELDSFYVFEQNNENRVVLNQGDTECENAFERYGGNVYDFNVDADSNSLFFETDQYFLLGGFSNAYQFRNIEFLIAKDSSKKIFKGIINVEVEGVTMDINYSLIAHPTDRP